jgi:hypothetical protein
VAAVATAKPDSTGTANFSAWANVNLTALTEDCDLQHDHDDPAGRLLGDATQPPPPPRAQDDVDIFARRALLKASGDSACEGRDRFLGR